MLQIKNYQQDAENILASNFCEQLPRIPFWTMNILILFVKTHSHTKS